MNKKNQPSVSDIKETTNMQEENETPQDGIQSTTENISSDLDLDTDEILNLILDKLTIMTQEIDKLNARLEILEKHSLQKDTSSVKQEINDKLRNLFSKN